MRVVEWTAACNYNMAACPTKRRGPILQPFVIDLNTLGIAMSCNCKFLNATSGTAITPCRGPLRLLLDDRYNGDTQSERQSTDETAGCHNLEGGGLNQSQISGFVYVVICFRLRYASKPASPSSLPKPLLFTPPQGA